MNTEETVFPRHTFVLKVNDRPGAMELIAATFAHRGVSLHSLLGNDDTLGVDGMATVLVTFTAPSGRKEALRGALSRLSRVVALSERVESSPDLRKSALLCLAAGASVPASFVGMVEETACNIVTGETTVAVLGTPDAVDDLLRELRESQILLGVTQTILAL